MSIFGTIMSKIFHHDEAAAAPAPSAPPTQTADAPEAAPSSDASTPQAAAGAAPENSARPTAPMSSTSASPGPESSASPTTAPAAGQSVDVAAVLNGLAAKNGQSLDWKHSIVDMMKLLGLDSSLSARQELAKELDYSGDTHDSATMNVWLHKQVMQKLAANGGKVPDDMKV